VPSIYVFLFVYEISREPLNEEKKKKIEQEEEEEEEEEERNYRAKI